MVGGESLLTKELHETDEWSDNGSREFDDYLEYDPDLYRNFDQVDEYHNKYSEFPMEDETIRDSVFEEEDDQKKKRSDDSKDTSTASSHHVSSTVVAQSIAATFVALIVVTGVIIPVIENSANDASAFIDCMIYVDELSVYGYVSPYAENENYVLIIYEDGVEIYRETMVDGHVSLSFYVNSYSAYKAEIRSGTPPLLLLASQEAKRV